MRRLEDGRMMEEGRRRKDDGRRTKKEEGRWKRAKVLCIR
jgi:hypothetical protein